MLTASCRTADGAREATIRRLSDENAALKSLLGDLGMGPVAIYGTDFPECPDARPHDLRGDVEKLRDAWSARTPASAMLWCATCNTMHLGDCPKAEPPAEGLVKVGKFWLTPEDAKRAKEEKR